MQKNSKGEYIGIRTEQQLARDSAFKDTAIDLIRDAGENWSMHSLAVMKRNALARVLYLDDVYRRILNVPGVICEFGVHWGATLATLTNLRALHEPYNHSRVIYGFDTFTGFATTDAKDGSNVKPGDYASRDNQAEALDAILAYHESIAPFPEHRKYELVKGDASVTVHQWMEANPHAIIALAILDMDVYAPTRDVLLAIKPRLTKGSLVVFDELSCKMFPGETQAVAEVLGLSNIRLTKHPLQTYCAIYEVA